MKTVQQLERDYVDGMNRHALDRKYKLSYESVTHHIRNHLPAKVARVAVIRGLATLLWSMLQYDIPYVCGGPADLRKVRERTDTLQREYQEKRKPEEEAA